MEHIVTQTLINGPVFCSRPSRSSRDDAEEAEDEDEDQDEQESPSDYVAG
jgi:hypothetical protein